MNSAWQTAVAAIPVKLGRDLHLEDSDLARDGGPEATLACAECGRAKWMHATRHDTCPSFSWVTVNTITVEQIRALQRVEGLSIEGRAACTRADNEFCLDDPTRRNARRQCAAIINHARGAR